MESGDTPVAAITCIILEIETCFKIATSYALITCRLRVTPTEYRDVWQEKKRMTATEIHDVTTVFAEILRATDTHIENTALDVSIQSVYALRRTVTNDGEGERNAVMRTQTGRR